MSVQYILSVLELEHIHIPESKLGETACLHIGVFLCHCIRTHASLTAKKQETESAPTNVHIKLFQNAANFPNIVISGIQSIFLLCAITQKAKFKKI